MGTGTQGCTDETSGPGRTSPVMDFPAASTCDSSATAAKPRPPSRDSDFHFRLAERDHVPQEGSGACSRGCHGDRRRRRSGRPRRAAPRRCRSVAVHRAGSGSAPAVPAEVGLCAARCAACWLLLPAASPLSLAVPLSDGRRAGLRS